MRWPPPRRQDRERLERLARALAGAVRLGMVPEGTTSLRIPINLDNPVECYLPSRLYPVSVYWTQGQLVLWTRLLKGEQIEPPEESPEEGQEVPL